MSTITTIGRDQRPKGAGEGALAIYLKEINKIPLLSRAEEELLARSAARGVPLAREKLVKANLRFVVMVAKAYHTQGLSLEDLISEGNIGLLEAAEHFNPEKGCHFLSYAVWWIRQTILRAISEKSRLIRLPQQKVNELLQIARLNERLRDEQSARPAANTAEQRRSSNHNSPTALLGISREALSLEAPLGSDDGFLCLEDVLEDKGHAHPEQILIEKALRDDLNAVLSTLSPRESEIVQCRFGLNGRSPMTLRQLACKCKVSRERIRQIQSKAMRRLRYPSHSNLLRAYN